MVKEKKVVAKKTAQKEVVKKVPAKPRAIKRVSEQASAPSEPAVVEVAQVSKAEVVEPKREKVMHATFKNLGKERVIKGSILNPQNGGLHLVLSFANTAGKPESPLYKEFETRWRSVKQDARGWYVNKTGAYKLGAVNQTAVQSDTWVIHCLCQDDDLKVSDVALAECLKKVVKLAKEEKASVHVGEALLTAHPKLKDALKEQVLEQGVSVYYYEA